jgi:hypothetical protein
MGLFGLIMFPSGIVLTTAGIFTLYEPAMLTGIALIIAGWLCLR